MVSAQDLRRDADRAFYDQRARRAPVVTMVMSAAGGSLIFRAAEVDPNELMRAIGSMMNRARWLRTEGDKR